jgi:hypothetical protein
LFQHLALSLELSALSLYALRRKPYALCAMPFALGFSFILIFQFKIKNSKLSIAFLYPFAFHLFPFSFEP